MYFCIREGFIMTTINWFLTQISRYLTQKRMMTMRNYTDLDPIFFTNRVLKSLVLVVIQIITDRHMREIESFCHGLVHDIPFNDIEAKT